MVSRNNMLKIAGLFSFIGAAVGLGFYFAGYSPRDAITLYQHPQDKPALMKMLQDDWYWLVSQDATDFSPEYTFEHRAVTLAYPDNSLSIYVARENGVPTGFVTYYRESGCKAKIQFLSVSQDHRKKGYGKKLLEYAIKDLTAQGMCSVDLMVRTNNIPAQTLYKKLGFKPTVVEDGFVAFTKMLI